MGVMSRRLSTVALMIAAMLLMIPRKPTGEVPLEPEPSNRSLLVARADRALLHWSAALALAAADSLLQLPSNRESLPAVRMVGFPPGARSPVVDSTVRRIWSALGTPNPALRILTLVYNRAPFDLPKLSDSREYSGSRISPTGCVAVVPGEWDAQRKRVHTYHYEIDAAVAPCVLYARFGVPGAAMRGWLEATRHSAALSFAWLTARRSFRDGYGRSPWITVYDESWRRAWELRASAAALTDLRGLPPYQIGAAGVRCLSGEVDQCLQSMRPDENSVGGVPSGLVYNRRMVLRRGGGVLEYHRPAEWFLSDLIRLEGQDKFARFWASSLEFEPAFRDAFGEEFGVWVRRWALEQWRTRWEAVEVGHNDNRPVLLGATLAPTWPLLVAGWTTLALALVAWNAGRRKVIE